MAGEWWFLIGAAWLVLLVASLVMITRDSDDAGNGIGLLPLTLAVLWTLGVLAFAGATYYVDEWQLCSEEVETTDSTTKTEQVSTDVLGTSAEMTDSTVLTTTESPAARTVSESCDGLSVAQVAVLLVPALFALVPGLSGLNIAGLFELSFKDVKQKLDDQEKKVDAVKEDVAAIRIRQDQIVTVNVTNAAGGLVSSGIAQATSDRTLSSDDVLGSG